MEWRDALLPLTTPEIRRLLARLLWNHPPDRERVMNWSAWRRRHQLRAMRCHYKKRGAICPL